MGRPVYKLKNKTAEDIIQLFKTKEKNTLIFRLLAVYHICLGTSSRDVAAMFGISNKQVLNWAKQFDEHGIDGLMDKPGRGRKRRLSDEQLEKLKQLLNDSPEQHGIEAQTWTGPLLIGWIEKEMGVTYQKAQIYNLLQSIGYKYHSKRGLVPIRQVSRKKKEDND